MSGEETFIILNKIFKAKNPKDITQIKGYTMKYGYIMENNKVLDEVLVSYFKKPNSYTTENMCEINSHGGSVIMRKILELCLNNGAELAEPRRIYQKSIFKWKNRFIASGSCYRRNKC